MALNLWSTNNVSENVWSLCLFRCCFLPFFFKFNKEMMTALSLVWDCGGLVCYPVAVYLYITFNIILTKHERSKITSFKNLCFKMQHQHSHYQVSGLAQAVVTLPNPEQTRHTHNSKCPPLPLWSLLSIKIVVIHFPQLAKQKSYNLTLTFLCPLPSGL